MKKTLLILICSLLFGGLAHGETKEADLAGSWYTASGSSLASELSGYLEKAKPNEVEGEIIALISPHAGYRYSGPVAAFGYKLIENRSIKTAIVVGFNHRFPHDGIAVSDFDSYKTPLGEIEIDKELANELIAQSDKIYALKNAFYNENSTEMQVPFLQMALKDFKLVILSIGDQTLENCEILSEALYNVLKKRKNYILIASSDMSHFLPYNEANEIDGVTLSEIKKFEPLDFYKESVVRGHSLMCGYGAVCSVMLASEKLGADKIEILRYANSGDETFDRRSVVGYVSAAIVRRTPYASEACPKGRRSLPKGDVRNTKQVEEFMLNEEQRKKLLKIARDSIVYYLQNRKKMPVKDDDPILNQEMGAFVTLHKHGELRGCIGNMVGHQALYLTIRDMAVEAATGDPRFSPVTLKEMSNIDIEISALSPLEKITDPEKIEMGKHGVIVKSGFASGVYLPQVATETGWTRDEFMNSLCGHKAGMAADAWKRGACEIYIFTAEVFGEKE